MSTVRLVGALIVGIAAAGVSAYVILTAPTLGLGSDRLIVLTGDQELLLLGLLGVMVLALIGAALGDN